MNFFDNKNMRINILFQEVWDSQRIAKIELAQVMLAQKLLGVLWVFLHFTLYGEIYFVASSKPDFALNGNGATHKLYNLFAD